jgi:hypothetical protein
VKLRITPGTDEHGLLIDLAHRRGFCVHTLGGGVFSVEKNGGERCFKGSAAEVHRWLRGRSENRV